ncbi:UNVERIFIED_CONTAM: hypothetical protein FKN15_040511 [Acipenser sinensis]
MCKTTSSLFFANIYGCTMFLTCICVDRYIAVVHPIKYLKLQRPVYRALVSCVIWLVIAIVVLTYAFSGRTANRFADGKISCMENFGKKSWSGWLAPIAISSSIAGFFLPFFSIVTCYSLIARRIMGMTREAKRSACKEVTENYPCGAWSLLPSLSCSANLAPAGTHPGAPKPIPAPFHLRGEISGDGASLSEQQPRPCGVLLQCRELPAPAMLSQKGLQQVF